MCVSFFIRYLDYNRCLACELYYPGDQITKNEIGGVCSTYVVVEGCILGLAGKSEGKRAFGRPRRDWEDNIHMDL